MILSLFGMFAGNTVYLLCYWKETDFPFWCISIAAVLNGLMGGFRMVTASVNSYLSDQWSVKKTVG